MARAGIKFSQLFTTENSVPFLLAQPLLKSVGCPEPGLGQKGLGMEFLGFLRVSCLPCVFPRKLCGLTFT